jgi:hypothetical protein
MKSIDSNEFNHDQCKQSQTLKRDIALLKNVRKLLKWLKFLEGNSTKQVEKSEV